MSDKTPEYFDSTAMAHGPLPSQSLWQGEEIPAIMAMYQLNILIKTPKLMKGLKRHLLQLEDHWLIEIEDYHHTLCNNISLISVYTKISTIICPNGHVMKWNQNVGHWFFFMVLLWTFAATKLKLIWNKAKPWSEPQNWGIIKKTASRKSLILTTGVKSHLKRDLNVSRAAAMLKIAHPLACFDLNFIRTGINHEIYLRNKNEKQCIIAE